MVESKVEILLSTFNGAKYVEVQIKSILNQSFIDLRMSIRDDGSDDSTVEILEKYERFYSNVFFTQGKNVGVVRSFLTLLMGVRPSAKYVAFSDQDDIWHPKKLEAALQYLSKREDEPAMYCGNVNLVNEFGDYIDVADTADKAPSFNNALVQNIAPGCTMVLNRPAIDLLNSVEPDFDNILMHDWWFYLVISAFGHVHYDKYPCMDYRQHMDNVLGMEQGFKFWFGRVKKFVNRDKERIRNQVNEFLKLYGDNLDSNSYSIAMEFLSAANSKNIFKRFSYILKSPSYRHSRVDNVIYKVLFVFGFS